MTDTIAADIIAPAIGATVPVSIHDTSGMVAGQDVKISGVAWSIVSVDSSTQFRAGNRSVARDWPLCGGWLARPEICRPARGRDGSEGVLLAHVSEGDFPALLRHKGIRPDNQVSDLHHIESSPQSYDFIPCCIGVAFSHFFVERAWQFRCRAHQPSPSPLHPS